MKDTAGTVYLLHFNRWVGAPGRGGARHYMGWCHTPMLATRLRQHLSGTKGSALTNALYRIGGSFVVARVWEGATPADESRWKRNGGIARKCPICRGDPSFEEPGA